MSNHATSEPSFGDEEHEDVAFVLQEPGKFVYEHRPKPALISSRDVLVKVIATGLCGSDIHYWQHGHLGPYRVKNPIVLGHESAGIVISVGPDVKRLKEGDRVALEPGVACNSCKTCRRGSYNLCNSMRFAATPPYDGTLATHYVLPEECCFLLPTSISFQEGAMIEPLSVAVHCCKLAGNLQGNTLVVFGAGPIGLLCCAVARAFGASKIIVVDVVKSRLEFAKTFGATATHLGSDPTSLEDVMANMGHADGADTVIDATGAESCINEGLACLKKGGVMVQAGLGKSPINFPVSQICDKEATFKGSFRYGAGDYDLSVELLSSGRVNVKSLITDEYTFEEAEKAFLNVAERRGIKTIIYGPGVLGETVGP